MQLARLLLLVCACLGMMGAMSAAAVAENVSLDAILADPTAYEGRELRIHGFLQIEYEGQSLWATEDDFHAQRYGRAAWLGIRFHPEILDDHRNGRRAYVTGILRYASDPRYSSHGPHEMWPVEITDISTIAADPSDQGVSRLMPNGGVLILVLALALLAQFYSAAVWSANLQPSVRFNGLRQ